MCFVVGSKRNQLFLEVMSGEQSPKLLRRGWSVNFEDLVGTLFSTWRREMWHSIVKPCSNLSFTYAPRTAMSWQACMDTVSLSPCVCADDEGVAYLSAETVEECICEMVAFDQEPRR